MAQVPKPSTSLLQTREESEMIRPRYIPVATIRKYAEEVLFEYERMVRRLEFPLDVADIFERLFELQTVFDDKGVLPTKAGDTTFFISFKVSDRKPRHVRCFAVTSEIAWPRSTHLSGRQIVSLGNWSCPLSRSNGFSMARESAN